jgi:hypothetical protein
MYPQLRDGKADSRIANEIAIKIIEIYTIAMIQ